MHNCEFCGTSFSAPHALKYHQKTAKYCLELRGLESEFRCSFCGKQLSEKRQLEKHQKKCPLSNNPQLPVQTLDEKDNKIDSLEKTVELLTEKISTLEQENSYQAKILIEYQKKIGINISRNITRQLIETEVKNNLTSAHLKNGADGCADFFSTYICKNRIECSDHTRHTFRYQDGTGKLVKDYKLVKLFPLFFKAVVTYKQKELKEAQKYCVKNFNKLLKKSPSKSDINTSIDIHREIMCLIDLSNKSSQIRTELRKNFASKLSCYL